MDEYYQKLVGKKIVQILKDPNDNTYGFLMSNGAQVWILRDEEGNGPGFAEIIK